MGCVSHFVKKCDGLEFLAEKRLLCVFLDHNDEVGIEVRAKVEEIPKNVRANYICEFVWNSTSFDRYVVGLCNTVVCIKISRMLAECPFSVKYWSLNAYFIDFTYDQKVKNNETIVYREFF